MDISSVLCTGISLAGAPCTRHRAQGETTCAHHHPDKVEERAAELERHAAQLRAGIGATA